jgi:hypothetical protein
MTDAEILTQLRQIASASDASRGAAPDGTPPLDPKQQMNIRSAILELLRKILTTIPTFPPEPDSGGQALRWWKILVAFAELIIAIDKALG